MSSLFSSTLYKSIMRSPGLGAVHTQQQQVSGYRYAVYIAAVMILLYIVGGRMRGNDTFLHTIKKPAHHAYHIII